MKNVLLFGTSVLALTAIGCAAETGDDTDDNKAFTVDGYIETVAPQPPQELATCNYGIANSAGIPGVLANQIVPSSHHWEGFRPGDPNPSGIDISEFYDCDGSKGIHGILLDTSKFL